ncbi:Bifunctional transcriptional activator/DNA repair enzyme AdaA [Pseudovibrio axinellae]|uniref:Bifunctional transcriptional activator/DNA repair enzyme AdaA n=1 Tax=Pseudovibrio axinellae TaxID=989403 RepID=A0A166ARF6_9HYPH|nr:AraC family transcriptional regulator [Pseudovibrio axinellae]KZL21460.1 Bifunctional transcriptional activator/DNA repair enzyme AdaA [Pseudovibrio axinellae]SER06085.1 transcriptional regulator, AraC family [Pseudovibrio axinellae]
MKTVTQQAALEATPLHTGENAQFWSAPRFDGLECLAASFKTHVYEPHTHDTFVVGGILSGCQYYWQRGQQIFAGPGDLVFVNPFELHDGIPEGHGYTYRMTYPSVSLLQKISEDLTDKPQNGTPYFPEARVHDPLLCQEFIEAHKSVQNRAVDLEAEEPLYMIFARMLAKYASFDENQIGTKDPIAIQLTREYLEESFMASVHLDDLAKLAGRSKYHLIRSFKKATGQTPHAYLTDVRIRNARRLLVRGSSPSETATLCGFADQAHLTRQFKSRIGTTPAAFQRSVTSI